MKRLLVILLLVIHSPLFSQDRELLRFFSKKLEDMPPKLSLNSYKVITRWDKGLLDSLFLRTLSLERYKPKYLGTLLKDQDTYEEINCFRVVVLGDIYYLYTNNRKQSLIVSKLDLRTKKWFYFYDMEEEFSLTLSILKDVTPDYDINRLKWKIKNL